MPTFTPYTKHQLDFALNLIGQAVYHPVARWKSGLVHPRTASLC